MIPLWHRAKSKFHSPPSHPSPLLDLDQRRRLGDDSRQRSTAYQNEKQHHEDLVDLRVEINRCIDLMLSLLAAVELLNSQPKTLQEKLQRLWEYSHETFRKYLGNI